MNPQNTVSYEQALANLNAGGLTGNDLAAATTALRGRYAQNRTTDYTAPRMTGPQAITADSLTPAAPYQLPQTTTTPTTDVLGSLNNQTFASATTLANTPDPTPIETEKSQNQKFFQRLMQRFSDQGDEVAKINEDAGIADKKARAKELANNIDQIDKNFRDEVALIKQTAGGSTAGVAEKLALAQDRYQNLRANAALNYRIANDDYQGAAEIANSKIKALDDNLSRGLQLYKASVDAINNDLTESEKLTVASNLRTKEDERKMLLNSFAAATQAGMDSRASSAYFTELDEAARSGNISKIAQVQARYGVRSLDDTYKQAQINYLAAQADEKRRDIQGGVLTEAQLKNIDNSPQGKNLVKLADLRNKAVAYKSLVEQFGTEIFGSNKTLLDNAYAELQIAWKEAANLGALTGPDLQLIQDSVKPSTGARGVATNLTGGGAAGIVGGIDQMLGRIDRDAGLNFGGLISRNPQYKNSEYVQGLSNPFFSQYKNSLNPGEILVYNKKTNQIGAIKESEFNSGDYQKL